MARVTGTVTDATDGERLDRVVAFLTGLSRSQVAGLVAAGAVAVGGEVETTRSRRVSAGDVLSVEVPDGGDEGLRPDPTVPFEVVHADAHLVVVDKPAGVVVHPGAGNATATLVHGLLARFPEIRDVGDPTRPGIVHRLDRGTSGLMVVARTAAAHGALSEMLADHAVERTYLGVVVGHLVDDEGVVDAPIGRSRRHPTRMTVTPDGRPSRTRYRVVRRVSSPARLSVVEFRLETGRTHQIRVHMAAIGHPLVGDATYGDGTDAVAGTDGLDRPALHACRLRFDHPFEATTCDVSSEPPADLAGLLASLDD